MGSRSVQAVRAILVALPGWEKIGGSAGEKKPDSARGMKSGLSA